VHTEVKTFSERSPLVIGAVGICLSAAVTIIAVRPPQLPFVDANHSASAFFAEAGGLTAGAPVQVSGLQVGRITDVTLDGSRVRVDFDIKPEVRLGDRTEAAIKTKSILGSKFLSVTPRGDAALSGPIPLERTTSPYELPEVLGDLTRTVEHLDTAQVSESLSTLAETFSQTPPSLKEALNGAARFAETIERRDTQLRNLLANASKATAVLGQHSQQIASLIADTNALLTELRTQSDSLDQLSTNISRLSQQLSGLVTDNLAQMKPALDKLNGVLTIIDNRKERLRESIKLINPFVMGLGESAASGPFFKAFIANLPPGQFMQPFVDAAFSDLGLDPNVLLPSDLTDPQTGQRATPALPVPYPRTGQGGEPRTTLPDAITGIPGDPRYPYREPLPAPPPGGPPPGPPAVASPESAPPTPVPSPVFQPAPNEVARP
jgi:phospholipid/cholesterol/gamma-HCH transport system substrate-binding protein